MKIAMVGSGYVGLVSGACFADFGHDVVCIDKDASKVERLRKGIMPIYEPGLDALTGGRSVEATVPGAGSVILNASPLPGELIDRCRERQRAKERAEQPAQDREEPQA